MNAIFTDDWFKRSADYTRANHSVELGCEGNNSSHLSSFLYNFSKANGLLKSSSELATELHRLAIAMGVNSGIGVTVDGHSDTSMTDGKQIIVSKKFDVPFENNFDELDLIIGLLCHEASHCLFTDFARMKKEHGINSLIHWFHNVIEDELIETKLGEKYPGYIKFIAKVKYYYFDTCIENVLNDECTNELDEIMKIFLLTIRYPKYLNKLPESLLNKYADLFVKIKHILADNSCLSPKYLPGSVTHLSLLAAREIYALLHDYIKEENENKEKGDGKNGNGNSNGSDGNGSSDETENNESENGSSDKGEKTEKTLQDLLTECQDDAKSIISVSAKIESKCSSSSETTQTATYQRIMAEKKKTFDDDVNAEASLALGPALDSIGDGVATAGDVVTYQRYVNEMRPYMGVAKSLIINNAKKDELTTHRFRRNGSLDVNKLADAMMGINTVYNQRQITKKGLNTAKYALVLMLDESGSMGMGNIHTFVSKLAVMMCEICRQYNEIELYIYGHGDNVVPYITKYTKNRFSVATRPLQGYQNEVISYQKIIEDVRTQTNLPILAINIADSAYLSQPDEIKSIIENYATKRVFFNLICLSGVDSLYSGLADMNNKIYGEGNWSYCNVYEGYGKTKIELNENITSMIKKLSTIIRKNYEKFK